VERIRSADGTEIAFRRSGSGPPLVLVHGTTADHSRWSRISPLLEAHCTVYAVDRRGRGQSGDGLQYSIAREGEDIAAVLESIGERATVLGHSFGGICCLEALSRSAGIESAILYEPSPVGVDGVAPGVRSRIEQHLGQGDREAALLTFFREVVEVPEAQLQGLRSAPVWAARIAAAHTVARETVIEEGYLLDAATLRSIETPTLLLTGAASPALLKQTALTLHELLPVSWLVEMGRQQHIAMDAVPELFADLVLAFMRADHATVERLARRMGE
jgi:pimeloyl-ACP methyl ester carboxylesterase